MGLRDAAKALAEGQRAARSATQEAILRWNQSIFFGLSVGALADEISEVASLRACRS
jgi:membrane-bound lytic murein transglycosylase B